MLLIIGGAYQGKLAYAKERFGLGDCDVYTCGDRTDMPGGKKIVDKLDRWILALTKADMNVTFEVGKFLLHNQEAVVICTDISCGIVPVEEYLRRWRESVGRALAILSSRSDEVIRLFCGIPSRIK